MFIRSTGEPVLAQVVGYSKHGDAVLGTNCIFTRDLKGSGFPKSCFHMPSLLPKGPNHDPRVLPKAFLWKLVSMFRSSRSSGAGPRNFTPSRPRSRSQYIGSPLNASYAVFFCFAVQFLSLKMCMYGGGALPQGGIGGPSLGNCPLGRGWARVGDRLPWGVSLGCLLRSLGEKAKCWYCDPRFSQSTMGQLWSGNTESTHLSCRVSWTSSK